MWFNPVEYFRRSLMTQLTVIVMLVTAVVLSGSGIYRYKKDALALEDALKKELEQAARYCAKSLAEPVFNFDDQTLISICIAAMGVKEIVGLSVEQGEEISLYFKRDELGNVVRVASLPEWKGFMVLSEAIVHGDSKIGSLHMVVTRKYMNESLAKAMKLSVMTVVVLEILLVFFLALILRFRFVRPMQALAKISSRISKGDFEQPIRIHGIDELSILARDISLMRDSIKQQFDALKNEVAVRQEAEGRLETLRNYLTNIIDSMPSVLVGVDRGFRVTLWNAEAHKETGISSAEAVGRSLDLVFPRLFSDIEQIRDAIKLQEVQTDNRRARLADGEWLYENVTIYPLTDTGIEGAVIRVDDVTEQVKIEEMMVQSEKMLSVGGLAAGMAHEINNPLAGMMQTANVIAKRLGSEPGLTANIKAAEAAGTTMEAIQKFMNDRGIPRMITTINESGQRVGRIVNNMLSFARKSDAQVSSHLLSELFDKSLELAATAYDLKKHYDFKTIEIIKDYEDDLPFIPCEETKIQQVFLNILLNGAEAMQEAGIDTPRFIVRIWIEKKKKMICMEIEDNGPGMDEEIRKRVFEPFFTTKPVGVGTGLGLSVSYFIITENHGGKMTVESMPGLGTKFIIRLPLERRTA